MIVYTTETKEPFPTEVCGGNGEWCGCDMADEAYDAEQLEEYKEFLKRIK